jgi:hypothetical protein
MTNACHFDEFELDAARFDLHHKEITPGWSNWK